MNEYDSVQPAYEEGGPKEVNTKRGMPSGNAQFGNGNKMPQDEKSKLKKIVKSHDRHREYR